MKYIDHINNQNLLVSKYTEQNQTNQLIHNSFHLDLISFKTLDFEHPLPPSSRTHAWTHTYIKLDIFLTTKISQNHKILNFEVNNRKLRKLEFCIT
jgi:hypothetical protein